MTATAIDQRAVVSWPHRSNCVCRVCTPYCPRCGHRPAYGARRRHKRHVVTQHRLNILRVCCACKHRWVEAWPWRRAA